MAIGATILRRDPSPTPEDYLPLATEGEFERHWRAVTGHGHFPTIEDFPTGVAVTSDQFASLAQELSAFAMTIARVPLPDDVAKRMRQRLDLLRQLLLTADRADVREIYIG